MSSKLHFALLLAAVCFVAALAQASAEEDAPHHLEKRSGKAKDSGWTNRPGSPTSRKTLTDGAGQQIDYTVDENGHRTSGYLAKGKNARLSSPVRTGQRHSGGAASTSGRKGH